MAQLNYKNEKYSLDLNPIEIFFAFHNSITFRKSNISANGGVIRTDKIWSREYLRGVRAPGTGFPLLIMLGTMRYRGGKDFCSIYRSAPAYIIKLENHRFKRIIISETSKNKDNLNELLGEFIQ
jgi:hypothetical protein